MTMMEKVALAMALAKENWRTECLAYIAHDAPKPKHATHYLAMAEAAIEAMREPTEEMMKAYAVAWQTESYTSPAAYQAMIDAALNEKA